jgi:large subunit ribosomal protein L19e
MTDLRNQKRMAAQVLGIGESRVWIDPLHSEDVAAAVTRQDIRGLVDKGYIVKEQAKGISRGRARALAISKSKGKRKGPGSRQGSATSFARNPSKQRWMRTIRPLRQTLQIMRDEEIIDTPTYRLYYRRAKGGVFRSRPHLLSHMVTDGLLTDEKAKDIRTRAEDARARHFGQTPASEAKPAPRRTAKKAKPDQRAKRAAKEQAKRAKEQAKAEKAKAKAKEAKAEAKPEAKSEGAEAPKDTSTQEREQ